jgi:hypothetical protein
MSGTNRELMLEHPVRRTIAEVVRDGGPDEEPAVFSPRAIAAIRAEIEKSFGSRDLLDCVATVLACAYALDEDGHSPTAADALLRLCDEPEILEALRALNRDGDDGRRDAFAESAEMIDSSAIELIKFAPVADAEPPRGSVKLATLDFPKKL